MTPLADGLFMHVVFWLPGICVLMHIFEEFVWPGKFLAWYRAYRPGIATSITPRFAMIGNAVLVAAVLALGVMGPTWSRGMSLWLILAALLAGNAVFHLLGAWRLRGYSPGMVTGMILYVPLCVWGYWYFLDMGESTLRFALVSFAIGASYEFWSMCLHRGLEPGR